MFVDGRGTPTKRAAKSSITVRGIQPWGHTLATALDLPEKSVGAVTDRSTPPSGRPWADVDVVLQADYVP